jgi:hypothetical protein
MTIITDEQQVPLAVAFKTAAGNPARVDGNPTWRSSNDTVVAVSASADGNSAVAVAQGPLGTVQISAEADADLGEGTRLVTGVIDIEVRAAEAVSAIVTAGAPEQKPAPTPPPS